VCVLRERGQADEAEALRQRELPGLLAAVRSPADTDASIDAQLTAVFAREEDRVANAVVLAELMAPLLVNPAARTPELTPILISAPSPGALEPRPSQFAPPPPLPAPARAAGSIADFIDEMIAQESAPAEAGPASRRRAS
jgi:hypothetical protein